MNREDIIRMAREAGIFTGGHPMNPWSVYPSDLERFATLVAAAEREACAEIAFGMAHSDEEACEVSAAIRARGQA